MTVLARNLDIGSLIANPQDSPFAKSLGQSKQMLVIPNSKGSIYTRIWPLGTQGVLADILAWIFRGTHLGAFSRGKVPTQSKVQTNKNRFATGPG